MKLLIVDDEPDILELYKIFLESKGKETILTTDGKNMLMHTKKILLKVIQKLVLI